jgi:hypothetical protein
MAVLLAAIRSDAVADDTLGEKGARRLPWATEVHDSLDSDVLFFGEPSTLFEEGTSAWMRDSSYMLDIESQASVGLFGGHPLPPLNAGVGRIERARFDLDLAAALLEGSSTLERWYFTLS